MSALGGPVLPDDLRWEDEATEARHHALETVRATAREWSNSIGLILGAFTTAAFIKGPEALEDIPADGFKLTLFSVSFEPAPVVLWLVVLGALVLAVALAAAALASQGTPGWTTQMTGPIYAIKSMDAARRSIRWLVVSRLATALAAAMILLGMAVAWTAQMEEPDASAQTFALSVGFGSLWAR